MPYIGDPRGRSTQSTGATIHETLRKEYNQAALHRSIKELTAEIRALRNEISGMKQKEEPK